MIFISAPFGNYIENKNFISTLGTFTPEYRGGYSYRIFRILKTLRYRNGAWENKLGLPNPGIDWFIKKKLNSIKNIKEKLISIGPSENTTLEIWKNMLEKCETFSEKVYGFEINISCPNVEKKEKTIEMLSLIKNYSLYNKCIIKIPPINFQDYIVDEFKNYHVCNTLPVSGGGRSGKDLVPYVINSINYIRENIKFATIIAGGGVDSQKDVDFYRKNGADHVAVGSAYLNILNWKKLSKLT